MITDLLLTTRNESEWRARLPASESIFGSHEYACIFEEHSGYQARLFVVQQDKSSILYPFFLRPVNTLPFAGDGSLPNWDTLSPDYTGPLLRGSPSTTLSATFRNRWSALCQSEGIIAEFAHLHPWDCQYDTLEAKAVQFDREIVYADLTWSAQRLWNESFSHACRKNINRAQREGVTVVTAESRTDIEEFYRIYVQTMNRNHASDKYYFSLDYFMQFFQLMPQHARFVLAVYQNAIVAATLYLHDNDNVYSYLGGADHAFQHKRPTNAVVNDTICWGQSAGKSRLILGAGYSPDDGILRFKASFSPLRAAFSVYKRIHSDDVYRALCNRWSTHYHLSVRPNAFFPAYREMPPVDILVTR